MRVEYEVALKNGAKLSVGDLKDTMKINGVEIDWLKDDETNLVKLKLIVRNIPIKVNDNGVIVSSQPHIEEKCHRIASYVANHTLYQTGVDVINPEVVLIPSPTIYPENEREKEIFSQYKQGVKRELRITYNINGIFRPEVFSQNYEHHVAFAHYAEAIRSVNLFTKYEQFYKVLEYFFRKKGKFFDEQVSQYASEFNSRFDQNAIFRLRDTRNRIIHPDRGYTHLYYGSKNSIKEIRSALPELRELAHLLIKNQPQISRE